MRIGVLTSGGDAPGMNAAIRAVVRQAIYGGCMAVGIRRGYAGLLEEDFVPLELGSVADIVQRGGTILRTARCPEFLQEAYRQRAIRVIEDVGIDGLVVIGGDGSLRGAAALAQEGVRVVGVPASIDNDLGGTEWSIGFDTAVNTALEALDRVRDTAMAHERTFVIEVMGRRRGFLALAVGLAGGAESILVPEEPTDLGQVCRRLRHGFQRDKRHSIIVVAEGAGSGFRVAEEVERATGLETRVTVLGHLQRGGNPTAADRILASRLGAGAAAALQAGRSGVLVGTRHGRLVEGPLKEADLEPPLHRDLLRLAAVLAI